MRTSKTLELVVGLFVALGLAAFFLLAMKVSDITTLGNEEGYTVTALFENIGGLKVRSPVTLAGVRIGRVTGIDIDERTYEAVVKFLIDAKYDRLPVDSSASIFTAGLVGEQYIGLDPGGMDEYLKEGSVIRLTQSALVIEQLVGRLLTSAVSGEKTSE
jgi:phospholipid/cholesterol/gamma-HCH transport system substrate-binding protein